MFWFVLFSTCLTVPMLRLKGRELFRLKSRELFRLKSRAGWKVVPAEKSSRLKSRAGWKVVPAEKSYRLKSRTGWKVEPAEKSNFFQIQSKSKVPRPRQKSQHKTRISKFVDGNDEECLFLFKFRFHNFSYLLCSRQMQFYALKSRLPCHSKATKEFSQRLWLEPHSCFLCFENACFTVLFTGALCVKL